MGENYGSRLLPHVWLSVYYSTYMFPTILDRIRRQSEAAVWIRTKGYWRALQTRRLGWVTSESAYTGPFMLTHSPRLQFQQIYAINLPARTDRRDGLSLVSSLAGIQLDWVDGVDGRDVPDKALPYPASRQAVSNANIGSWRAHMNALKEYVPAHILLFIY
jgi:hypothetical protein